MIYYGTQCKINNCNICYYYLHSANEYYCNYCGSTPIDENICNGCGECDYIHFDCDYCEENPNIFEIDQICTTFTDNINIIKTWYKNIKRNKILWKIAEYYTQKKYNPQNEFMKTYINDFN